MRGEDFRRFIDEIREQCGSVHPYGYRILPKVGKTKVFTVRLREEHGHGSLILIFGQENVYFIAWETADHVVIFDDLKDELTKPESENERDRVPFMESSAKNKKKGQAKKSSKPGTGATQAPPAPGIDYPRLATADKAGLLCAYPSLIALADSRHKIELGYHALRKIELVIRYNY